MHAATARPWLLRATTHLRQCLTAAAVMLVVGLGATATVFDDEQPGAAPHDTLGLARGHESTFQGHRCSTTGFGADVIPALALVRFDDGSTRLVSFDRGWASFTGDRPGTLLAVCLDKGQSTRG